MAASFDPFRIRTLLHYSDILIAQRQTDDMIVLPDLEKSTPTPATTDGIIPMPLAGPELEHRDRRRRRFRLFSLLLLCSIILLYKTFDFSGIRGEKDPLRPWHAKDHHHGHHQGKRPRNDRIEKLFLFVISLLHIQ